MKILVHDYPGYPFPIHLTRHLARRGHQVTHAYFAEDPGPKGVLAPLENDPPSLRFVGISIGRPYDKASFYSRHVGDLEYGRRAGQVIRESRPDVVISGNTPTEAQAALIQAARAAGAGFIFWMQDFYSIAASVLIRKRLGLVGAPVGLYYRFLEKRQLRDSDAVVVITEDFRTLASEWAGRDDKVHTIENWASLDDIHLGEKDNAWSRAHDLSKHFTFLYTGTLGRRNNHGFLARLAHDFAADAATVVVGQGTGMKPLAAMKADRRLQALHLLPPQPDDCFSNVLATGDVLVGLLEADAGKFSVPSKIQSYLCAGRPILLAAPRENLAARTVMRENAGIVVDADDEDGFAAAAARLRSDPELRARLGANGRAYAARTFDLSKITDSFEAVLNATVNRSRA